MKSFSIGPLTQWKPISTGVIFEFEVPASAGHRSVNIEFMADRPVTVWAVTPDQDYLLATGEGHLRCAFTAHANFAVSVLGDPDAQVFMQTRTEAPVIPESLEPTMTDLAPRPAGPHEDVAKMMRVLQLREQARQEAFEAQMQELRSSAVPQASRPGTVTADPVIEEEGGDDGAAE